MTDRELLEAAAKAAGLHFEDGRQLNPKKYLVCPIGSNPIDCTRGWNPLTDDGDALRLANKLQLTVQIGRLDGAVVVTSNNDNRIYSSESWLSGQTSDAATRCAIVMAAAEIGAKKL